MNIESKERATIDVDLSFEMDDETMKMKNLVIAEIKQERQSRQSSIMTALKEHYIRPERISKYCIGVALLSEDVKKNQFKSKLLKIENLENGIVA